jgi:hypothetical protein
MKPSRVLVLAVSIAALIAAPTATPSAMAAVAACADCHHSGHDCRPDASACEHPCTECECEACAHGTNTQVDARLNALQVRFLVLRGELDDHRALSGHFRSVAADFAAGARAQEEFARTFPGNPNRYTAVPAGDRARQRAAAQRRAAAVVSALATYHAMAAVGLPFEAPADAAAYWAGAGAAEPTRDQVRDVERQARLPREHRDLAEYFTSVSREQLAAAASHEAHAAAYRGTRIAQAAAHCERIAAAARREASWASGRSVMHTQLAMLPR